MRYSRPVSSRKPPRCWSKSRRARFQLVQVMPSSGHARACQLHLELPHFAADRDDLRHTGDGRETRTQHPVGVIPRTASGEIPRVDGMATCMISPMMELIGPMRGASTPPGRPSIDDRRSGHHLPRAEKSVFSQR